MVVCPDPTTPGGVCAECSVTDASAWYGKKGNKICKKCYDVNTKAKKSGGVHAVPSLDATPLPHSNKRQREAASPVPNLDAFGADAVVSEIYAIKDEREFDLSQLERWECRNANTERVNSFEVLVHCKIHVNDKDKKGEDTLLWMPVPAIMLVEGMTRSELDNMFEVFDEERTDARVEALRGFRDHPEDSENES